MSALGSSPSYYDFDAFQEMQVSTGGTDTTLSTGGVVINMVTKRGTNQWRGSARFFDTPGNLESATSFNNNQLPPGQTAPRTANQISLVRDVGAEIGGPIVKDRLWFWGAYGDQKADIVAFGGATNKADLPTWNGKANAQLTASNSLTLFVLNNAKTVLGRLASETHPQPTTLDQGHAGKDPSADKAEDTQIFGPNFYLTGLYSNVNGGFSLVPEGGVGPTPYRDPSHVWHYTFSDFSTLRPQNQGKLDASTFFNLGSFSNELKFGAGYRRVEVDSLYTWGPAGRIIGSATGINTFDASRDANFKIRNSYTSGYVQDTLNSGSLTANLGVRYDLQQPHNLPSTINANAADPTLLPAVVYGGGPGGFSWSNVTPRLGVTYALGKERKTLLRGSYSRFADQLGTAFGSILNPTGTNSYYYFNTPDSGPGIPTHLTPNGQGYSGNVNPFTRLPYPTNGNAVAANFSAPLTDEVLASVEHAILPELVVSANLTYRRLTNQVPVDVGPTGTPSGTPSGPGVLLVFDDPNPNDPALGNSVGRPSTRSDFIPTTTTVTLPNGQTTTVTYYVLKPTLSTRGGAFLSNSSGQSSTYKGASLALNKRLSNHWMMRGNFSYSDWKFGSPNGIPDLTELLPGGNRSGDAVLVGAGAGSGPKEYVFINSKWSGSLNGMYQVAPDRPWGFNAAGNLTARQGYALPYYVQVNLPGNYAGGPTEDVLVGRPDANRLPDLYTFDARLEKELTFQSFGLTLSVDCFNLFNSSTITQRVTALGIPASATNGPNYVYEILAPRVYRFGARLSFR